MTPSRERAALDEKAIIAAWWDHADPVMHPDDVASARRVLALLAPAPEAADRAHPLQAHYARHNPQCGECVRLIAGLTTPALEAVSDRSDKSDVRDQNIGQPEAATLVRSWAGDWKWEQVSDAALDDLVKRLAAARARRS